MTAFARAARSGRGSAGGGLLARSAWRLLALLGLAFVAVLLFSTSAKADGCSDTTCQEPAPAGSAGLVHGLLTTTHSLLQPLLASTPAVNTPAVAFAHTVPASSPATSVPSAAAAFHDLAADHRSGSSTALADQALAPVRGALTAVAPADHAATPLHDTLTPLVGAAAHVAAGSATAVADTTSRLPVLGTVTGLLREVATTATNAVMSTVDSVTTQLDASLAPVTAVVGTVLAPVYAGGQHLPSTSAPVDGGSSIGPGQGGATGATAHGPGAVVAGLPHGIGGIARLAVRTPATVAGGVPATPPESAGLVSAVQSAPAIVSAPADPMTGAVGTALGSTPGSAPSGSTGSHGETEAPRAFAFRGVMVIGGPAVTVVGPLPGTPLVDPGFSPD